LRLLSLRGANFTIERQVDIHAHLEKTSDATTAVLFYDGACGFCNGIVRFILDNERTRTLRFATLQGSVGEDLFKRHPELREIDSVVWLEPGSAQGSECVYVRSDAALRVASYLGGFWRIGGLARAIPRCVRDAVYDLIARHRHRLTRGPAFCRVPPADDSARFLDTMTS
jgi:predicted DCC family thiol-disulfide oxidoreductase YuxK